MSKLMDLVMKNQYTSVLDTSRNVKPDKPKGYLVKTPLYKAPFEYVEDLAHDTYGVVKGWNGKANDHELGKQNDLGIKLGVLAIAAYLSTMRVDRVSKIMEFIGAGSFLASMSLWPKLAIALPLKLRTGVDIQQKYVDSHGRKKRFFQDPQYLPWDLYSNAQIQKMGKKMGVPMDVPNRDEVIKEKARKLAVQGNTLWLATAGFATPIMTSLICRGVEPLVDNLRMKHDIRYAEKILSGQVAPEPMKYSKKVFEDFLNSNMGKKIWPSDKIISLMDASPIISRRMPDALKEDLSKILTNVWNDVDESYVDELFGHYKDTFNILKISKKELIEAFRKNGVFGNQRELHGRYAAINPKSHEAGLSGITSEILDKLVAIKKLSANELNTFKINLCSSNIDSFVKGYNLKVLDEETAAHLRKVFDELCKYYSDETLLRRWEDTYYTKSIGSLTTRTWNKVSKTILSSLNLSPEELKTLYRKGGGYADIVDRKMNEIVADPKRYKEVVSKIANIIAEYDSIYTETRRSDYRNYVNAMCQRAKKALTELGFTESAKYIGGGEFLKDAAGNIIRDAEGVPVNYRAAMDGSLQNLRHILYDENVLSQRATMYRFIQALDLKKRMAKPEVGKPYFERLFDVVVPKDLIPLFKPKLSNVEELAQKAIMKLETAGHECKLGKLSGPREMHEYKVIMRLLYGALPDKVADEAIYKISKRSDAVAEALEKGLDEGYRVARKIGADRIKLDMVRTGLAPSTISILHETSNTFNGKMKLKGAEQIDLISNFKVYFQTFIDKVVNAESDVARKFNLLEHDVTGAMKGLPSSMSPSLHKSLIGATPADLVAGAAREVYPRTKWLKRFGIAGAVILAGTLIATTFFGHIPQKEMYMSENKNDNKGKKVG